MDRWKNRIKIIITLKMKMVRVLILEDDLETLSVIFKVLARTKIDFIPIVLSTYEQVEKLINPSKMVFDLILLDRDCAFGGSFHILDIEKFGVDKIIAISSVPEYNDQLRQKGVSKVILKNYANLDEFSKKVVNAIGGVVG